MNSVELQFWCLSYGTSISPVVPLVSQNGVLGKCLEMTTPEERAESLRRSIEASLYRYMFGGQREGRVTMSMTKFVAEAALVVTEHAIPDHFQQEPTTADAIRYGPQDGENDC
jgi:hypothetical protein